MIIPNLKIIHMLLVSLSRHGWSVWICEIGDEYHTLDIFQESIIKHRLILDTHLITVANIVVYTSIELWQDCNPTSGLNDVFDNCSKNPYTFQIEFMITVCPFKAAPGFVLL